MARFIVLLLVLLASKNSLADFTVVPNAVSLTGPGASSKILVQELIHADQQSGLSRVGKQITTDIEFLVADANIAKVEEDRVVSIADGATELLVRVKGQTRTARIPITVNGASSEQRWQFSAHIQSIMARQGCNSGACHGALAGKGGFRLSLLGYDAKSDHFTMTVQDQGRRFEPTEPGSSLLLTKPCMEVAHKGGLRLEKGSRDYKILSDWIAAGAVGPNNDDAGLLGIQVLPGNLQVAVGDRQQLLVRARYDDGRMEDVTHWAKFSSSRATVADVDANGMITIVGQGRGTIVAWFASRIAIASIDVPHTSEPSNGVRQSALANFAPKNRIDSILMEEWKALGLAPSPVCDDATFLRRAYLDATGSLPSSDVVMDFIQSNDPSKRERLIDRLLGSREYIDYWSYVWSDLLLVNGNLLRPAAVEAFYKWIRTQVELNTPWDQFAKQIVLAKGDSVEQGATNFYAIHQTPEAMTENVCLAFMGLSIECAKCHNHPLERWTNDQYYAMANMFSRVRAKGWGGDSRNGDGKRTLVVLERGDLVQPSRGKPQLPAPLDEPPLDPESTEDRREELAEWLTHSRNTYFSRSIVNRVWANFMGTGLVESVDDLRVSNPPSSQKLMQALTEYVIANDYDLKSLMRLIMNSQVYQLSSEAYPYNQADQRLYSHHYPRRLMAEVLHDAVATVTEVPTVFDKIEFSGADKQATNFYPLGTKSLALYDSAVSNYFLQTFGRNQRRITCDCERSDQPTVVQALHLNNGTTINEKLAKPECVITKWIDGGLSLPEVIDKAYIRALSRMPSETERNRVSKELSESVIAGASQREAYEDLLWTLMSSTEFLFSH